MFLGIIFFLGFMCIGLVIYAWTQFQKFQNLTALKMQELVRDLLVYGFDFESLVFEQSDTQRFIQFKKYIYCANSFGLDAVVPIVGHTESLSQPLMDMCEGSSCEYKKVKTQFGWSFLFIEVAKNEEINEVLVSKIAQLVGVDFDHTVSLGSGTTYRIGRRKKIWGNTKTVGSVEERYSA